MKNNFNCINNNKHSTSIPKHNIWFRGGGAIPLVSFCWGENKDGVGKKQQHCDESEINNRNMRRKPKREKQTIAVQ